MALPREQSRFDLPGAQAIVPGSGFAAEAAAENQIAKVFDGTGDYLYRDAARLMTQKGKDAALAEPMRRGALEYEEFDKNPDGSVSRRVVRDPTGKILPPETAPYSISFYDQAFHAAALERYGVDVGNAARAKAAELATRYPNNPAAFSAQWASYREAQLKGLAIPYSGPAAVTIEDVGQQHFRHIVETKGRQDYKATVVTHTNELQRGARDVLNAAIQGRRAEDPEMQRMVRSHFDALDRGVTLGFYTKPEADELKRSFQGQFAFAQLAADISRTQGTPGVTAAPAPDAFSEEKKARELQGLQTEREIALGNVGAGDRAARYKIEETYKQKIAAVEGRPVDVPKPPDARNYISGRQRTEAFLKGDATVRVVERDDKGKWALVEKKASDILSLEERKDIAAKGLAIVEFNEATRGKIDELHQRVTTQQSYYDKLDALLNLKGDGLVDLKRIDQQAADMAQRGRPDLAISQWSFGRSVEEWQRRDRDRVATDIVASTVNQGLFREITRYGVNPFEGLDPELQNAVLKGSPAIVNQLLRYKLAEIERDVKAQKVSPALQHITAEVNAARQRQREAVHAAAQANKPAPVLVGANIEQTESNAKALGEYIQAAVPGHVWGANADADREIVRNISGQTGLIDHRVREYMNGAFAGGDPKQLRQAIGLGNMLYDLPNVGPAKLKKLLGEQGYDAYQIGRQAAQYGRNVEGMAEDIGKVAAGQPLTTMNEEAVKAYVDYGRDWLHRYIVGDRRTNLWIGSIGVHMLPLPSQMLADFDSEVKRLAATGSRSDVAERAFDSVKLRWSLTNKIFHRGASFNQPDSQIDPLNVPRQLFLAGPFTSAKKWWTDKDPERLYPQLGAEGIDSSTRAQVLSQFEPGEQFKTASELRLGKNMWLADPQQRGDRLYWKVMVTGRDGQHTLMFARPGTSPSGYTEVSFDEEATKAQRASALATQREAADDAEQRIYDHRIRELQQRETRNKLLGIGRRDTSKELKALQLEFERRKDNIGGARFNPADYGLGGL